MKKKKKGTVINPEFVKAMHKNTTFDDHGVVILQVKLTRTCRGYKEKVMSMDSFPEGLYEFMESLDVQDCRLREEKKCPKPTTELKLPSAG